MSAASWLYAGGAVALWASFASLVGHAHDVPPWLLTGISLCCGSLASIHRVRAWRVPARVFVFGTGCLFVYHVCLIGAFHLAPIAAANMINYLWPLLMVVLAARMRGRGNDAVDRKGGAGCAIACLGCVVAVAPSAASGAPQWSHGIGYACAAVAALTWAVYSLGTQRLSVRYGYSSWAAGGFCLGAGVMALGGHLLFEPRHVPTLAGWASMAAIGLGPLGLAFVLWDRAMRTGQVARIGTLAYATPALSMLCLALTQADRHANWPAIFVACALNALGLLVGTPRGGAAVAESA